MLIKLVLLLCMTLLGSLGGFFFKKCTSRGLKLSGFFILNLGIGGVFYVLGALLNIQLLKMMPYTIVYPLTSITYIWTLILSSFFCRKNEQEKMVRDSARHYRGIFPYHVDFKSSCLTLGLFFSRIVEISKNQSRSYREKKIGQQGGKQDGGSPIF